MLQVQRSLKIKANIKNRKNANKNKTRMKNEKIRALKGKEGALWSCGWGWRYHWWATLKCLCLDHPKTENSSQRTRQPREEVEAMEEERRTLTSTRSERTVFRLTGKWTRRTKRTKQRVFNKYQSLKIWKTQKNIKNLPQFSLSLSLSVSMSNISYLCPPPANMVGRQPRVRNVLRYPPATFAILRPTSTLQTWRVKYYLHGSINVEDKDGAHAE